MLNANKYFLRQPFLKKSKIFRDGLLCVFFFFFGIENIEAIPQTTSKSKTETEKARHFLRNNRLDSALYYFRLSAAKALQQQDEPEYLVLRLQIASCFLRQGNTDSALWINQKVKQISRKKHLEKIEVISENALGQLAARKSQNEKALEHFTAALTLAGKIQDKDAMAFSHINRGNIFTKLSLYGEAADDYQKALQYSMQSGSSRFKKSIYRQLAYVLEKEGKKDSAMLLLRRWQATLHDHPSSGQQARYFLDKANYFRKAKNESLAMENFQLAYEQAKKEQLIGAQREALAGMAEIALYNDHTEKAIEMANKALKLPKVRSNSPDLTLYRIIYLAWKHKKNPDSALFYHEKLLGAQQVVFQQKQLEKLADLKVKYQTDLTQKYLLQLKNKSLEKDIRLKKRQLQINTLLGSSLTLILLLVSFVFFYLYKHRRNKEIREQERKRLVLEKEAEAARALIIGEEKQRQHMARELHDGIGVLLSSASIYFSNIEKQENTENNTSIQKARQLVDKAGAEIRRISHNMMPVVLSRFGLKAALEDLFDDFSERGNIKISFHLSPPEHLDEKKEILIFRMIQELLNNTIKHSKADEISFVFRQHGTAAVMEYRDNGQGFHAEQLSRTKGMGLSGIFSRIDLLRGTYILKTFPGQGFRLNVTFPL